MNIQYKATKLADEKVKAQEKLNAQDKTIQRKDPKMMDMTGTMDFGPVNSQARASEHEGEIMAIATKEVVTLPPTTTIMGAIKTMTNKGFRRVPITDAGTNRLEGIVTSVDVIDFLGGGDRNLLVENKYKGNLLVAINESVHEIMQNDVAFIKNNAKISEALEMMLERKVGGIPIVDGEKKVVAICTEKDFVSLVSDVPANKTIGQYMTKKVKTVSPDTKIGEAAKIMIKEGLRRLPLVRDEILVGLVTASDIMHYLGNGEAFDKIVTGDIHEAFDEPIGSLISKDVVWATSDMDLGKAASLMMENDVGSLPVIDEGTLCGIITERDFLKAMSKKITKANARRENIKVADIMSSPVYIISPEEPISHARGLMLRHKISTIVVIDNEKMVGIVNKADIGKKLAQAEPVWRRRPIDKIPVSMVMRESPITIYPEATISQAISLMLENEITYLPVVSKNVVGIVTMTDIVRNISEDGLETKVSEFMTEDVVVVHRHHTINHVIDEMNENEINRVVVINDMSEAVGMISASNLAMSMMQDNEGKLPVKNIKMARRPMPAGEKVYRYVKEVALVAEDIMSSPLITIKADETVVNAAKIMIEEDLTALPVEEDDDIVGIISRTDVMRAAR
ncbi:CBS domain-containing protein [Methanococcoides vulcani]|uniref:CBS domain-containing protein n=1 Tax=Methanococcoides vulcani TaxID=1353158 RepID=A0A1I0A0N7_9EURY|nr:CBS domain-containing protein [Methanococcoides vulcani]